MPPEPMSRVKSHLRSLYQYVKSLSVCAITNASTAATHGLYGHSTLLRGGQDNMHVESCVAEYNPYCRFP